jgi:hypothetical protein
MRGMRQAEGVGVRGMLSTPFRFSKNDRPREGGRRYHEVRARLCPRAYALRATNADWQAMRGGALVGATLVGVFIVIALWSLHWPI